MIYIFALWFPSFEILFPSHEWIRTFFRLLAGKSVSPKLPSFLTSFGIELNLIKSLWKKNKEKIIIMKEKSGQVTELEKNIKYIF